MSAPFPGGRPLPVIPPPGSASLRFAPPGSSICPALGSGDFSVITRRRIRALSLTAAAAALTLPAALGTPGASATTAPPTGGTVGGFAYGELQAKTVGSGGCGTNTAGEPSIHVTK